MGIEGHGRGRARWLVPAVAAAGVVAAVGARARAHKRAGAATAAGSRAPAAGGAVGARPSLPSRHPARRRTESTPPTADDVDVATRALTALGASDAAPDATVRAAPPVETSAPPEPTTPARLDDGTVLTAPARNGATPRPANGAGTPGEPGEPAPAARGNGHRDPARVTPPAAPPEAAPAAPADPPPRPRRDLAPTATAPPAPGRTTGLLADLRRRRRPLVVATVLIGMGIGAGAAVAGVGAGDGTTAPAPTTVTTAPPTTPSTPPLTAGSVFPAAADHLVRAGSFRYTGEVSASDVSHLRPMLWLSVDTTVEGEVSLGTAAAHEVAVGGTGRASETIAVGQEVWGRTADDVGLLGDVGYVAVPELSGADGTPPARGAALLPRLLRGATAPAAQGLDDAGRRTFTAVLPAALVGPVERGTAPVDARLVIAVDDQGAPAQVEIETEGGPPFRMVIELADIGAPVSIAPPP